MQGRGQNGRLPGTLWNGKMLYVENEQKPTKGITSPVRLELTTSGLEVQRAIHCAKETYRRVRQTFSKHVLCGANCLQTQKKCNQNIRLQMVTRSKRKKKHGKNMLPRRGIEPRPRRWERRILTTRPPGTDALPTVITRFDLCLFARAFTYNEWHISEYENRTFTCHIQKCLPEVGFEPTRTNVHWNLSPTP